MFQRSPSCQAYYLLLCKEKKESQAWLLVWKLRKYFHIFTGWEWPSQITMVTSVQHGSWPFYLFFVNEWHLLLKHYATLILFFWTIYPLYDPYIFYCCTATGHHVAFSVLWGAFEHAQGWVHGARDHARSLLAFRSPLRASPTRRGEMRRSQSARWSDVHEHTARKKNKEKPWLDTTNGLLMELSSVNQWLR